MMNNIVLLGFNRTAIGSFQGQFANISAVELTTRCVTQMIDTAQISPESVSHLYIGNVLAAGLGQHPARQILSATPLTYKTECMNINKVCGSGMMSVQCAANLITNNPKALILAGGMENMSQSPYLVHRQQNPKRLSGLKSIDHIISDGLTSHSMLMGEIAEKSNNKQFSRHDQDEYAVLSLNRYLQSLKHELIGNAIVPIDLDDNDSIIHDQCPSQVKPEKLAKLKPVFSKGGSITAGNASALADGASLCLLGHEQYAPCKPLARLMGFAGVGTSEHNFLTAPAEAIEKLLHLSNWKIEDIDLFEINEAFALAALLNIKRLGLDIDKVNIFGGACTMGHPLGMSGNRIIGQLYHALIITGKTRGIAAICIGGGEALALAMEIIT